MAIGAQHWLRKGFGPESWQGRRAREVRELGFQLLYGQMGMQRVVNGTPVRILPQHRRLFPSDYEAPVAEYLRQRIRPGMTCLNVGANVGVYALQLAAWSSPGGRVLAFEPNPHTAADLRQHVAWNRGLGSPIEVLECAVSSTPGSATFFASDTSGMSRLGKPNPLLRTVEAIQVEVTSLDVFCSQQSIDPDWIFIDVEGFEIAVLLGCRNLLQARRGRLGVTVEMHSNCWQDAGTDRQTLESLLTELDLHLVPITGQADPFLSYGLVQIEP